MASRSDSRASRIIASLTIRVDERHHAIGDAADGMFGESSVERCGNEDDSVRAPPATPETLEAADEMFAFEIPAADERLTTLKREVLPASACLAVGSLCVADFQIDRIGIGYELDDGRQRATGSVSDHVSGFDAE